MTARERVRIAVQKSGRLSGPAFDLLGRCGLHFRRSRNGPFCHGDGAPVDLLLVRDDDIPGLIAQGACDLGTVGRHVFSEFVHSNAGARLHAVRALGLGRCQLAIAVPEGQPCAGP